MPQSHSKKIKNKLAKKLFNQRDVVSVETLFRTYANLSEFDFNQNPQVTCEQLVAKRQGLFDEFKKKVKSTTGLVLLITPDELYPKGITYVQPIMDVLKQKGVVLGEYVSASASAGVESFLGYCRFFSEDPLGAYIGTDEQSDDEEKLIVTSCSSDDFLVGLGDEEQQEDGTSPKHVRLEEGVDFNKLINTYVKRELDQIQKAWTDYDLEDVPTLLTKVVQCLDRLKVSVKSKNDEENIAFHLANVRGIQDGIKQISSDIEKSFQYIKQEEQVNRDMLMLVKKRVVDVVSILLIIEKGVSSTLDHLDLSNEFYHPETLYQHVICYTCRMVATVSHYYQRIVQLLQSNDAEEGVCSAESMGFFHREEERLMERVCQREDAVTDLKELLEGIQTLDNLLEKGDATNYEYIYPSSMKLRDRDYF